MSGYFINFSNHSLTLFSTNCHKIFLYKILIKVSNAFFFLAKNEITYGKYFYKSFKIQTLTRYTFASETVAFLSITMRIFSNIKF